MIVAPPRHTVLVAGVDEAGRGPLAGPVVVAAVILDPARRIDGLDDSKKLSEKRRERLYPLIVEQALAWRIEFVEVAEIDTLNILQATLTGMRRALQALSPAAQLARIDGNRLPRDLPCEAEALVGGDAIDPAIMAASIQGISYGHAPVPAARAWSLPATSPQLLAGTTIVALVVAAALPGCRTRTRSTSAADPRTPR
jgi:hypothetical protein